jgi:D-psicose/D-tagatose/L-ribulose 3-epimerase
VLGSPKQRTSFPGQGREGALAVLKENLASLGSHANFCSSRILIEALDRGQCDTINTLAEARALVKEINSPGIGGMFDFHNVGDETEPWEALIREFSGMFRHVHINEMDGGPPGSGSSDYRPAFRALKESGYSGWMSMEIFTEPENPGAVIKEAINFIREQERG